MMRKIVTLGSIVLCVVMTQHCSNGIFDNKSPGELRRELLQEERKTPHSYLEVVDERISRNKIRDAGLFRSAKYDGWILEGKIENKASLAGFKDVSLKVTYFSQTGSIIEERMFTLYEFYEANTSNPFEIKVYPPSAMESFGISITSASPIL